MGMTVKRSMAWAEFLIQKKLEPTHEETSIIILAAEVKRLRKDRDEWKYIADYGPRDR